MEQTNESTQRQKPKICKLAILSPLVVILGFLIGVIFAGWLKHIPILSYLGFWVLIISPFIGLVLGIIADQKIHKSRGILKGRVFSILGTGLGSIGILLLLLPTPRPSAETAYRVVCGMNLAGLRNAIALYGQDYGGRYPTADKWCDLIAKYADVNEIYVCRGALKTSDKGPCHYALNPNCSPDSPNDVVLLFETKGGWNQYGGPELLTVEHHKSKGCNILFNDGSVKFIETEQIRELKWGNEPKDEPKQ